MPIPMKNSLTIIIPTYNRPRHLAALLKHLSCQGATCRILVIDSSPPEVSALNRAAADAQSQLELKFVDLSAVPLMEKWRRGVHMVETPYCMFCADDDLVILNNIGRCLDVMREDRKVSVAQGYSFTFLPLADGNVELNNIAYFSPSIAQDSPLERVAKLFEQYQATTYGIYRTSTLKLIMDRISDLTAILSRELMWSALSVVEGSVIRVPVFTNGRSMGASGEYEHWHPLEWLSKDPEGLMREYLEYRAILTDAVLDQPYNSGAAARVERILDLIHLRYLVKHAPDSALGFITSQQFDRVAFKEYWPDHKIQIPLYKEAGLGVRSDSQEGLQAVKMAGRHRNYAVLPNFYAGIGIDGLTFETVAELITQLDDYQVNIDDAAAAEPAKENA
jgi:glycosyltransferase domain-containing protein